MEKTKTRIHGKMSIGEIVDAYPETIEVFRKHGLHCIGCSVAAFETLEDGAKAHGIDLKKLLEDLNKKIAKK